MSCVRNVGQFSVGKRVIAAIHIFLFLHHYSHILTNTFQNVNKKYYPLWHQLYLTIWKTSFIAKTEQTKEKFIVWHRIVLYEREISFMSFSKLWGVGSWCTRKIVFMNKNFESISFSTTPDENHAFMGHVRKTMRTNSFKR